jgi:hypothetical protein
MRHPFGPPLTHEHYKAVVFVVLLAIFVVVSMFFGPEAIRRTNYGFGPDMECYNPGSVGGLTCLKRRPGDLR